MRAPAAAPSGRPTAPPQAPDVFKEDAGQDTELLAFQQKQKAVPKLSAAEHARTLVATAKWGMLCTMDHASPGFPLGSVVEFAANEHGLPIFAVSSLSAHTKHLQDDGRVSLTVMPQSFTSLADARFTLQGSVRPVEEAEKAAFREAFLKKYPDAFWVDFADFKWFVMDHITAGRYYGGFAQAKKLTGDEYVTAQPDPVAQFSAPVCGHMNDDHERDTKAIISHYCGLAVDSVKLLDLDRLGMNAEVKRKGQTFKMRIPFSKPANDRKGIKEAIVEMTKTAVTARAAEGKAA